MEKVTGLNNENDRYIDATGGAPGTSFIAKDANARHFELVNAIEGFGVTLDGASETQLRDILVDLLGLLQAATNGQPLTVNASGSPTYLTKRIVPADDLNVPGEIQYSYRREPTTFDSPSGSALEENDLFDALSSTIPVIGNKIDVKGGIRKSSNGRTVVAAYAERISSTIIYIRGLQIYSGSAYVTPIDGFADVTDGDTDNVVGVLSW